MPRRATRILRPSPSVHEIGRNSYKFRRFRSSPSPPNFPVNAISGPAPEHCLQLWAPARGPTQSGARDSGGEAITAHDSGPGTARDSARDSGTGVTRGAGWAQPMPSAVMTLALKLRPQRIVFRLPLRLTPILGKSYMDLEAIAPGSCPGCGGGATLEGSVSYPHPGLTPSSWLR